MGPEQSDLHHPPVAPENFVAAVFEQHLATDEQIDFTTLPARFQITNVHSNAGYRVEACSRLMNGRNS